MNKSEENIRIVISYKGTLESGVLFDEVPEYAPQEVVLGSGALLPALEEAIVGMLPGETRTIQIPPHYGYGLRRDKLVHTFDRAVFGDKLTPRPGMVLSHAIERNGTTEHVPCTILSVDEHNVQVDYNHPLAGQQLTYTITMHDIR